MAITFSAAGTGFATETTAVPSDIAHPATTASGDILLVHLFYEGTVTAPTIPGSWTLISGPQTVTTVARNWLYGKIADGTEGGTTERFSSASPASTNMRGGRIYRFVGRVSGTIDDNVPAASVSFSSHASQPQMPTVTTTKAGSLACAFCYQNDNNTTTAATGMSGGTWAEAVAEFVSALTPGLVIQLQTCTPTGDPGTVSGGSGTGSAADPSGVIGCEVRDSVPPVPDTGMVMAPPIITTR